MWEHAISKHRYTEVRDAPSGFRAKSATTGRWVKVAPHRLIEVQTPQEVVEAESFVRRQHLEHLAWQLARELPYNLGTAVTNIALFEHGGSLLTARAALRDEMERVRQDATTDTTTESEDTSS